MHTPQIILFIGSMLLCNISISSSALAARCADFNTQQEAQEYYARNSAGELDRDDDGVACESLPRSSNSSPDLPLGTGSLECENYPRPRTNLRSGSSTSSRVIAQLDGNDYVTVHSRHQENGANWSWVTAGFPDGSERSGWIRSDLILCEDRI